MRRRSGSRRMSASTSGADRARVHQHAVGEVEPHRPIPATVELTAEVPRAAGEVDHQRPSRQPELAHRTAAPPHVHPERHHAVHQVVARRDRVEQPADVSPLLFALRQLRRSHGATPVRASWAPRCASSAVSSRTRRKWCETRAVTAGNSSPNASTICWAAAASSPGRVADRLADVLVEQLDGTLGEPAHRRVGIARQRQQVAERQTELQQAQRRPHQVDVGGGVALLTVDGSAQPDALALHRLDQRCRHAAARRERVQIVRSSVAVRRSRSERRRRRRPGRHRPRPARR